MPLPGDLVFFFNAPRYKVTRKPYANSNYSSENAVCEGLVNGQDRHCGFSITSRAGEAMLQALINNYNAAPCGMFGGRIEASCLADLNGMPS